MRVLINGSDASLKNCGGLIGEALAKIAGVTVDVVQGPAADRVSQADVVVLVPASHNRDNDNALLSAMQDKRLVVVADTGFAAGRVAQEFRSKVNTIIVPLAAEMEETKKLGYGHVRASIMPQWGKFHGDIMAVKTIDQDDQIEFSRKGKNSHVSRQALNIVYIEGVKNPQMMNRIILATSKWEPRGRMPTIAFKNHPREMDGISEQEAERLKAERNAILNATSTLSWEGMDLSQSGLIRNADVCLFTGGPTSAVGAAFARRPMLYFMDDEVREYNAKQAFPDGEYFVPRLGGAEYVNSETLVPMLYEGHDPAVWKRVLKGRQEKNFPLPPSWDTAGEIARMVIG